MPFQPQNSPLSAFLASLKEAQIEFILIGAMAAIRQGAPLMTIDYGFWVNLPERQYTKLLALVQNQGGTILARTFYELSDGTQNTIRLLQPGDFFQILNLRNLLFSGHMC